MSRREKTVTLVMLWAGIGASMVWSIRSLWLEALLLVVAVSVTVHVARIKVAVPVQEPATSDASS
jgi:hypothetical protein